jgi:hypothetical protein
MPSRLARAVAPADGLGGGSSKRLHKCSDRRTGMAGRRVARYLAACSRTRRPVTPRAAELWFLLSLVLDFLRGCQWGPVSGGPSLSSCNADVNPPGRWNMAWIAPFLGGPAAGGGCQCHWQCQWPNGPSQASHPVAEAASPCLWAGSGSMDQFWVVCR